MSLFIATPLHYLYYRILSLLPCTLAANYSHIWLCPDDLKLIGLLGLEDEQIELTSVMYLPVRFYVSSIFWMIHSG